MTDYDWCNNIDIITLLHCTPFIIIIIYIYIFFKKKVLKFIVKVSEYLCIFVYLLFFQVCLCFNLPIGNKKVGKLAILKAKLQKF